MKKPPFYKIVLLVVVPACGALWSQTVEWKKPVFSQTVQHDRVFVCAARDRGFTVAAANSDSISIVHTDSAGEKKWAKFCDTYDSAAAFGYHIHLIYSFFLLDDNGYVLAGMRSLSLQTWDRDAWMIRTDSLGSIVWEKTFGQPGYASDADTMYYAYSIIQAKDRDFIACGYLISGSPSVQAGWVCRMDPQGATRWFKTYDCYDIKALNELSDETIILTGTIGSTKLEVIVFKVDKNGDQKWRKTYLAGVFSDVSAALRSPNGNLAVLGTTDLRYSGMSTYAKSFLLSIDTGGTVVFEKFFGTGATGFDYLEGLVSTPDGGYVMSGAKYHRNQADINMCDMWVVRADASGDTVWTLTSPEESIGHSVALAADSGFVIAADYHGGAGTNTSLLKLTDDKKTPAAGRIARGNRCAAAKGPARIFDAAGRLVGISKNGLLPGKCGTGIYIYKSDATAAQVFYHWRNARTPIMFQQGVR
jgi:hypothetical protein